jgi:hypothetical protein
MQDKQLNTLLITVGLVIAVLYLSKPKASLLTKPKVPDTVAPLKPLSDSTAKTSENGMIAIDAMRTAIKEGIPQAEIDQLQAMFVKEYGLKVFFGEKGKLVAKNEKLQVVAKE